MGFSANFDFDFENLLTLEAIDLQPNSLIDLHLAQLLNLVNFYDLIQGDCCTQPSIDKQIECEICLIINLLNYNLPTSNITLEFKSRRAISIFKFIAILIDYYSLIQATCIKGTTIKNIIMSLFTFNNILIMEITSDVLNNYEDINTSF